MRSAEMRNVPIVRVFSALGADEQQRASTDDRGNPCPLRNVDRFLFLDRQLDRTDLRLVRVLGVAEAAVGEAECPGDDQYEGGDAHASHCSFSPLRSMAGQPTLSARTQLLSFRRLSWSRR